LEALRQAESQPVTPDTGVPASAPAQPSTAAQAIEADRKAAADKTAQDAAAARKLAREEAAARKKNEEEARRAEKLRKEMEKQKAATATATTGVKPATPAQPTAPVAPYNPPPAVNPAMTAKEQKLADLLRRYQNDEITPYQYHTERARIIAEP
jgi:hypothetical protein